MLKQLPKNAFDTVINNVLRYLRVEVILHKRRPHVCKLDCVTWHTVYYERFGKHVAKIKRLIPWIILWIILFWMIFVKNRLVCRVHGYNDHGFHNLLVPNFKNLIDEEKIGFVHISCWYSFSAVLVQQTLHVIFI